MDMFQRRACASCHVDPELTLATYSGVFGSVGFKGMGPDAGFFYTGVEPFANDPGIGDKDPFGALAVEKRPDEPGRGRVVARRVQDTESAQRRVHGTVFPHRQQVDARTDRGLLHGRRRLLLGQPPAMGAGCERARRHAGVHEGVHRRPCEVRARAVRPPGALCSDRTRRRRQGRRAYPNHQPPALPRNAGRSSHRSARVGTACRCRHSKNCWSGSVPTDPGRTR